MLTKRVELNWAKPPLKENVLNDLEWFCLALGLTSARDKDKTTVKILRFILEKGKRGKSARVEEMSEYFGLTKAAVKHHVNKLEEKGVIVSGKSKGREYELRMPNLLETVEEIEQDSKRIFSSVKKIAKQLDKGLEMPSR